MAKVKRKSNSSEANKAKGIVWTFPKNILEEAILISKAIDEKNAGNLMHSSDLSKALGFNLPND